MLITVFFWFLKMSLLLIITLKFLCLGVLLASHFKPSLKQKLVFYKNFGISSSVLFVTSFFIDSIPTIFLVLTLNQF